MIEHHKKESPIIGLSGMGGGVSSHLFTSSGDPYLISKSVRFDATYIPTLQRSPSVEGNRKTFTFACWAKKCKIGAEYQDLLSAYNGADQFRFIWEPDGNLEAYSRVSGTTTFHINTTDVFRDPSAWYHIMLAVDATQVTASDRVKIYVNGNEITNRTENTAPQNLDTNVNRLSTSQIIGKSSDGTYYDGYLADVHLIDGQQLTPDSFTQTDTDGILQPKAYTGDHGTNGFWMKFEDGSSASALGTDSSGNGNNLIVNGFTVSPGADNDHVLDSPSTYLDDSGNIHGNYCTLDPLIVGDASENGGVNNFALLSNGNLDHTSAGAWSGSLGTFPIPTTGKWYWEVECRGANSNIGIAVPVSRLHNTIRDSNESITVFYSFNGNIYYGESPSWNQVADSSVNTYTTGDFIGFAVDMDSGTKTIKFYKNGSLESTYNLTSAMLTAIANQQMRPMIDTYGGTVARANFGQYAYQSTPPTGYKNLINYNLTNTTIKTSGTYVGSGLADGPPVFINGVPTGLSIGGSPVTFSPTTVDKLAYGFKIRSASTNNTKSTSYSYSVTSSGAAFKNARGQITPG